MQGLGLEMLMVRPKRLAFSASLSVLVWRSDSVCAIRTQSLAKIASWSNFSVVLAVAPSLRRLSRESCNLYLRYTPLSKSRKAYLRTRVKGRLNRTGASTQPCFTPLEMLNGAEVTAVEHRADYTVMEKASDVDQHPVVSHLPKDEPE